MAGPVGSVRRLSPGSPRRRLGRRVVIAATVGLLYWLLESLIHVFVLHSGNFAEALAPHSANELWMRSVIVFLIATIAMLANAPLDAGPRPVRALASAIDHADESIVITDTEGHIQYANPAFTSITGYGLDAVVGKTPAVLKSGLQTDAYYQALWATIHGGELWSGTITDRRRDGSYYPAKLTIVPIRNARGAITHFVGIQRDESESAALRARLEETAKMARLGEVAGRIAHDFNNALATMAAIAGVASRRARGNPELEELLSSMGSAVNNAGTLPRDLLAFARNGKTAAPAGTLDVPGFVERMGPALRSLVPEGISFEIVPPAKDVKARADAHGLQHALANLVINAVDAVEQDPDARIVLAFHAERDASRGQQAEQLAIRVSDNGPGIPAERQDKIFEPFFTTKGPTRGTGLGLPNALETVRHFGGDLQLEPRKGAGATFVVLLPTVG